MNLAEGLYRSAIFAFFVGETAAVPVVVWRGIVWLSDPWRIVSPMDQSVSQFWDSTHPWIMILPAIPILSIAIYSSLIWVRRGFLKKNLD